MPSSIPATTIRIDPEVKREATAILDELGLSMSTAVNAFLRAPGRDAVRDEGQGAGARREDGEIAGKSTWGDGTLTIDPTDLEHIAPLPDSNPARGRFSCNFKKMIGAECQSWSNRAKSIQQFR